MNILKKYPVITSITMICLLFAIITSFNAQMYDLFSFHSKPVYIWQYFSGTFMYLTGVISYFIVCFLIKYFQKSKS